MYTQTPRIHKSNYAFLIVGILISTFTSGMAVGILLWEAAR